MKRLKKLLSALLVVCMVLSMLPAIVTTANAAGDFVKATSIAVGDKVVIVYESGSTKMELAGIDGTSSKPTGMEVAYTSTPAGTLLLDVVQGSTSSTVAFKNGSNYLNWTSGNYLNYATSVTANSSWTVSFSGDTATIANGADSTRLLQYNTDAPRFCCYTGTQQNVQIYKQQAATPHAVTVTQATGGTIAASTASAVKDTNVTLKATPDGNHTFGAWTVSGATLNAASTDASNSFTMPDNAVTVTATFIEIPSYTVTAAASPAAGGTVSYADGIITATANAGYDLAGTSSVSPAGAATVQRVGTGNTFAVTDVTQNCTVSINFTAKTVATLTYSENGVTKTDGEAAYVGDSVTLDDKTTANIPDGYTFMGWTDAAIATASDNAPAVLLQPNTDYTLSAASNTLYAVYAVESQGGSVTEWHLVSDLSTLQAGVYALLTTDYHAFNGTIPTNGHGQVTSSTFSFTNGVASAAPTGTLELTLAASGSGFTMYNASNGYLYASAASSGSLAWQSTETSYWNWSNTNWSYAANSARLRSYNNASFRTYSANNGNVMQMAQKVESAATIYTGYTTSTVVQTYALAVDAADNGVITATPAGGSAVAEDGTAQLAAGVEVTLSASPAANYRFDAWMVLDGNGDEITVTDNKFTMPASDVTIMGGFARLPSFEVDTVTGGAITATAAGGSAVLEGDIGYAAEGTIITLAATPDANWNFAGWTVIDGDAAEVTLSGSNTFVMPASGAIVSASFTQSETYTVTFHDSINTAPAAQPVIDGQYATAPEAPTPPTGYAFSRWSTAQTVTPTATAPTAFDFAATPVTADTNLYAIYVRNGSYTSAPLKYELSVEANNAAFAAEVSASKTADIYAGEVITLTATPNAGYRFVNWTATNMETLAETDFTGTTYTMPDADVILTANFELIPTYSVTATQPDPAIGSYTATPSSGLLPGDTVTLYYTLANQLYKFGGYTVTNNDTDETIATTYTASGYTFPMPAADVTVTASFLPPVTVTYHSFSGETTAQVKQGAAIGAANLPTLTDAPDTFVFKGWSETEITGAQQTAPTYYDGTADVTADLDLYAVYAVATTTAGGASSVTSLSAGTYTFYIINTLGTSYYAMSGAVSSSQITAVDVTSGVTANPDGTISLSSDAVTDAMKYELVYDTTATIKNVASGSWVGGTTGGAGMNALEVAWSITASANRFQIGLDKRCILYSTTSSGIFKNYASSNIGKSGYGDGDLYLVPAPTTTYSGFTTNPVSAYPVAVATGLTGGTISASVESGTLTEVTPGTVVTLGFTTDPHYIFNNNFTVTQTDGTATTQVTYADGVYSFVMPSYPVTVTASFTAESTYNVNIAAAEGGTSTATPDSGIYAGTAVTLTPNPDTANHYHFVSWQVINDTTSEEVTVTDNSFLMPAANVTVTATYALDTKYEVNMAVTPSEGGTASFAPAGTFFAGETVTVSYTANAHYDFTGWTTDNAGVSVTDNTFVMPAANITVTANFTEHAKYTLTLGVPANGTITATPDGGTELAEGGTAELYAGTVVTLTQSPDATFHFGGWLVPDGSIVTENNGVYTFEMPAAAATVSASFTSNPTYDITVAQPAAGGDYQAYVTVSGQDTAVTMAEESTVINLRATTVPEGYTLNGWSATYVDGDEVTQTLTVTNNQFTMPAFAVTVTPILLGMQADTVVLDYAQPVTFNVLTNDSLGGLSVQSLTLNGAPAGAVKNADNTITYTPSGAIDEDITFSYTVTFTNGTTFENISVTLKAAQSVYYEETNGIFAFADGKRGEWTTEGTDTVNAQTDSLTSNDIFEYDANYNSFATYSGGSIKKTTVCGVDTYAHDAKNPSVSFDFQGTGFDIVSLTSGGTGVVVLKVMQGNNLVKSLLVDTFYGYLSSPVYTLCEARFMQTEENGVITFTAWESGDMTNYNYVLNADGHYQKVSKFYSFANDVYAADSDGMYYISGYEWSTTEGATNYQVPIAVVEGLPYGTYTVVLEPTYSAWFDHNTDNASYDFYFDAVRIHNPLNEAAEYKYINLHENMLDEVALFDGGLPTCEHVAGNWTLKTKATGATGGTGTMIQRCTVCGTVMDSAAYRVTATATPAAVLPGQTVALEYALTYDSQLNNYFAALTLEQSWTSSHQKVFSVSGSTATALMATGSTPRFFHLKLQTADEICYAEYIPTGKVTVHSAYTVSYQTPVGTQAPTAQPVAVGSSILLPAAVEVPAASYDAHSYSFAGWVAADVSDTDIAPAFYAAGAEYTPTGNTVMHAVYTYIGDGYRLSDAAPVNGDNVILAGKSGADYYAMLNSTGDTVSVEALTVNAATAVATNTNVFAVASYTSGVTFGSGSNYLHLNNGSIKVASNKDNADLGFTASGDGFTVGRYISGSFNRWLTFDTESHTFGSTDAQASASVFYFFIREDIAYYTTAPEGVCPHIKVPGSTQTTTTTKVPATCEATGTNVITCNLCGEVISTVTVPALGHNYSSAVTTAATCTADGVKTYTCQNDASHTYTEPIAALGHSLQYSDDHNGTSHTVTCLRGDVNRQEPHIFVDAVCTVCGGSPPDNYLAVINPAYITLQENDMQEIALSMTNNGIAVSNFTVTLSGGNTTVAEVEESNGTYTAMAYGVGVQTVTATFYVNGTEVETATIEITVTAEIYTASFSVPDGINAITTEDYIQDGNALLLPDAPSGTLTDTSHAYTFLGWTDVIAENQTLEPEYYAAGTTVTLVEDKTYYALYSYSAASAGTNNGQYTLLTAAPQDWTGDYLIVYDNGAMKAVISSERFAFDTVTPSNNVISNPDASLVWHIAADGTYYTLYNASTSSYAGGTGVKNKAALHNAVSDSDRWTISGSSTFEFVNKGNTTAGVNKNLRKNGTYGFACYSTDTGGALSVYKAGTIPGTATTYYTTEMTDPAAINYTASITGNGTITTGDSETLTANLYANGVKTTDFDSTVSWSAGNSNVTLTENGVTATAYGATLGTTVITVTFTVNGQTVSVNRTITVADAAAIPDGARHSTCTGLSTAANSYYSNNSFSYTAAAALGHVNSTASTQANNNAAMSSAMFSALNDLMTRTMTASVSYSSLTTHWRKTDSVDGGSSDNPIIFYGDIEQASSYNREHVWPKSNASFYEDDGGCDIHHLRPANSTLNSTRGNYTMGNVRGVISGYSTKQNAEGTDVLYYSGSANLVEVNDNIKGDVARVMLYVWCRWEEPNLFVDDDSKGLGSGDNQNLGIRAMEDLDTVLEWMAIDPVDQWEMNRNDRCETIQHNRNVFIDYPEFAWLLFGQSVPANYKTPSNPTGATRTAAKTADAAATDTIAVTNAPDRSATSVALAAEPANVSTETKTAPAAKAAVGDTFPGCTPLTDATIGSVKEHSSLYEIYLTQGEGVVFYLSGANASALNLQIGAKCVDGSGLANLRITALTGNAEGIGNTLCLDQPLATATELFYEFGEGVAWSDGTSCAILIQNTGSGTLALTDLRYSGSEDLRIYINRELWELANTTRKAINAGVDVYAPVELPPDPINPTDAPTSEPPTGEPPTSEPPTSEPPTSEPPTSEPPTEPEVKPEQFKDLKKDTWYYDEVAWAIEQKLMNGVSETEFAPDETLTRAMLVTILYRLAGEPEADAAKLTFTDVPKTAWYAKAVAWAQTEKIATGVTATEFAPNDPVTREQMVTLLWRFAGEPKSDYALSGFTDADKISNFAKTAFAWAVEKGVVNGDGNGLNPKGLATRAQIATIFYRAKNILAKQ